MSRISKGRYVARFAQSEQDLRAAQALRYRAFPRPSAGQGAAPERAGLDADAFDPLCRHVLVEEAESGRLVCCYRLLPLAGGAEISRSYAAQYYELSGLSEFEGPMVEVGRFCVDPDLTDPDIPRIAWAALTRFVDANGVRMLFGCSSFKGTETEAYGDAFALLKARHLGPQRLRPKVKAPNVFRFAQRLRRKPDPKRGLRAMPPLLRSYLMMGGWVSDHAVVDRELDTLHVFTGLDIGAIPAARKRLLRAAAG
ncbi:hypothetical protein PSA7680_00195 [Pseudoruegeria aquimaris]|uniref:L-ornithine N(alpha)-acyltransferase n=1 Tax=Pseudoruegeria aquimaris TaxID=393663 RepID=A0A1Y5R9Q2_9RHOB|nr:GNAT family N-acetyltransferase [Pseudoruegeria aquimaris]SLN12398.1 hypothetical protein PSA7680_00195 [Pseudoruegeria aquimaris]